MEEITEFERLVFNWYLVSCADARTSRLVLSAREDDALDGFLTEIGVVDCAASKVAVERLCGLRQVADVFEHFKSIGRTMRCPYPLRPGVLIVKCDGEIYSDDL